MTLTGNATAISLNSIGQGQKWAVCPEDSVGGATGAKVSMPGYQMPATSVAGVVPGVVFTAYVEAGKEKEPEYADNIYKVDEAWYSRPFWYRTEFATPKEYKKGKRVWLHCDNTNRYADFWVNGKKVSGTADSRKDVSGHMMRSDFDITDLLSPDGKNAVAILIYDTDQKKTRKADGPYGVACSPSYLAGAGWDWMPYVPGRLAGVTGNVSIEVTGSVALRDPWVRTDLNEALTSADAHLSTLLVNPTDKSKKVTVKATIMPGNYKVSKKVTVGANDSLEVKLDDITMENPRLWWPNGYGDPNLYTATFTVEEGGKVSDSESFDFGVRRYSYEMVDNVVDMPVMRFYVNGKPIFLKGGNWGMSEYLLRCHGKDYETKIKLHKDLNYNVIRLWTGCVTDDEFYDYCDRYGIMVWNDFWLYVAYNDVAEPEAFCANALDKVRRLRNHASIALWCGANETHPKKELDDYLREMVAKEDGGDRMYKSCSNQDGLSGSGWWGNQPSRHHFSTSASNLAFNDPPYPYGIDHGYGMRSEIGMATFPVYESVIKFIPEESRWPLPDEEALKNDDENVWNRHFFGKEASNASPMNYIKGVNRYGEPSNLEEFCEKAQLLNIEDMKGMYEAWNDKMWNDAAGLIIWMSQSAYPSFVWQTYDYYNDCGGAYWGARKACEHRHIQWNSLNNSIKVINSTPEPMNGMKAVATLYDINGQNVGSQKAENIAVEAANIAEAFTLNLPDDEFRFIRLQLFDKAGNQVADNFYWRGVGQDNLDYTALQTIPEALVTVKANANAAKGEPLSFTLTNMSSTPAFGCRLRLLDSATSERILPVYFSDNYLTLMPGESKVITVELPDEQTGKVDLMIKQYLKAEKKTSTVNVLKEEGATAPSSLKAENLLNPIALATSAPRLSWQLPSQAEYGAQTAYEIIAGRDSAAVAAGKNCDLWNSGKISSTDNILVAYAGKALSPGEQAWWSVRVWGADDKPSDWSAPARFGIGYDETTFPAAEFIGMDTIKGDANSPILATTLNLPATDGRYIAHVNSLGYHELYVNGQKASATVLNPAVSQLNKRSLIMSYDITPLLHAGDNHLALHLGSGWYKPRTYGREYDGPVARAVIDRVDGSKKETIAATDGSWKAAPSGYEDMGPWTALSFVGERVDGRKAPADMSPRALSTLDWSAAKVVKTDDRKASPSMADATIIRESVTPVSVTALADSTWLVDMGKVLTGWFDIDFHALAPGQEVKMEYSDYMKPDGQIELQGEYDIYTGRGAADRFCNRFHHHAYRYVKISGLDSAPICADMRGHRLSGDYETASSFACSDADLNAIHDMIHYTVNNLTMEGYMVDCPHLERAGYGGDGNSSTMTLQTMYNVNPTFTNWMQGWGDAMRPGGSLPHVCPNPGAGGGGPYWCGFISLAPWRTYVNYADTAMIATYYPMMKEWMSYVDQYTKDGMLQRWPDTPYRDWYLGDWLAPMGVDTGNQASIDLVSNCLVSEALDVMSQSASLLGLPEESKQWAERREKLNALLHKTYYNPATGDYATGSQLDMSYPINAGVTPDSLAGKVSAKLMANTAERHNNHIAAGLVGVPIVAQWAIDNRQPDFMATMLRQRDYPGYLYMIDNGATATWEYWSGERSRVHNCYNGIGQWFYQALAGIRPDPANPGYRHFFIDPQPAEGVDWARATKLTPYGEIEVAWQKGDNGLTIEATVPQGSSATLLTPMRQEVKLAAGKHTLSIPCE